MFERKIILFGGSFDPIHLGHIQVAEFAFEYLKAEKLIFIPVRRSPLKAFFPVASDVERFVMIKLAIEGYENFLVSDYELQRPAPAYTLETVRYFLEQFGSDVCIHCLVGADSIGDLIHWYKITELIDLCNLSIMYRAGFDEPDFNQFESIWGSERIKKLQKNVIGTPLIDISSTEIRARILNGQDVSSMLDEKVLQYIKDKALYKQGSADAFNL
jgi:nicotinate-nucleotide adenylyltransferase